jgi:hypothetical protein
MVECRPARVTPTRIRSGKDLMTLPEHRLAQELLATADALRTAAVDIQQLDSASHPAVVGTLEAAVVHAYARPIADALKALAARLDPSP